MRLPYIITIVSLLLATPVLAQEQLEYASESETITFEKNPILTDRFFIRPGWYFPVRDINVGIQGSSDLERINDIDFDETLNLDKGENSFNLDFTWRFSKNKLWYLSGEYFSVGSKKTVTLEDEIEWEDVVYPVGGEVKASYGVGLYRVFFGRVISRGLKHELNGGLGVHGLNVKGSIEGMAYVDDQSQSFEKRKVDAFLPLPNIGLWYIWAPTKRLSLSARLDWFGIKLDNISGGLWNVSPGITFQIIDNVGINANYQFMNFNADVDLDNWAGDFDLSFSGPSFRIVGNF